MEEIGSLLMGFLTMEGFSAVREKEFATREFL
jgi:hypothetical protein